MAPQGRHGAISAVAVSLGFQQSPVSATAWSMRQGGGKDSPRGAPARLTPSPVAEYIGDGEDRTQDTLAGKVLSQAGRQ